MMNPFILALLLFVCLTAASLGSLFASEKLPEKYRQSDTQAVVRLVANIFVVLTSLVLGLMISSSKDRFDTMSRDIHTLAIDIIVFDRLLSIYGPEADDTHKLLVDYVERAASGAWRAGGPALVYNRLSERLLDDIGNGLRSIAPPDGRRLAIWNDAREEYRTIFKLRWVLLEQSEGSIPPALVWALSAWLVLIFASFGYQASRNIIVVMSFPIAAVLVSGALFLALDMDGPLNPGLITVSPAPLQRALAEIQR
jgi:hypothetical protein